MPAYVIAEIEVTDPERYEQYKALAPGAIAAYGGRFVVRGGEAEVMEGEWNPKRLVVVEYDSLEKARAFYHSPEYTQAIEARRGAARVNMVIVEGL